MRSIPAHAGEPMFFVEKARAETVYPRPRGGTVALHGHIIAIPGLAPPTRGNRSVAAGGMQATRSIPAHAGEPHIAMHSKPVTGVYPRPRGGTSHSAASPFPLTGLSSPTRGNQKQPHIVQAWLGSIPAHAGEPLTTARFSQYRRVYPRPRGGTMSVIDWTKVTNGLSPPTRGTISGSAVVGFAMGLSRPRGGTSHSAASPFPLIGLSPPTRGNQVRPRRHKCSPRSIPAHAGEPTPRR